VAYEADLIAFEGSGGDAAPGLDVPGTRSWATACCSGGASASWTASKQHDAALAASPRRRLGHSREKPTSHLVWSGLPAARLVRICRESAALRVGGFSSCSKGFAALTTHGPGTEQRRQLDSDLHGPCFAVRVLDLLSRDLAPAMSSQEGMALA